MQKPDESVNDYNARCIIIFKELEKHANPGDINIGDVVMTDAQKRQWNDLDQGVKDLMINKTRAVCDIYSKIILTSGLKSYIRSKILDKDLTTLLKIKMEATRIEMLEGEKNKNIASIQDEDGPPEDHSNAVNIIFI